MASNYEDFWDHNGYAVVGHSAKASFPKLSYNALKDLDKTVYAVIRVLKRSGETKLIQTLYPSLDLWTVWFWKSLKKRQKTGYRRSPMLASKTSGSTWAQRPQKRWIWPGKRA